MGFYTVPDPYGHDIKLDSVKTGEAFKFMIILQNLITTNHRQSGKKKYDCKLPELDVGLSLKGIGERGISGPGTGNKGESLKQGI